MLKGEFSVPSRDSSNRYPGSEREIMKRGEIYRANLDPVVGSEQGGVRRISAEDVRRALGKYELAARRDGSDYLMEVSERADA